MSIRDFKRDLNWNPGRLISEDGLVPAGMGIVIYEADDGDLYPLTEFNPIPQDMKRHAFLFEHKLAKARPKKKAIPSGPIDTLNAAERARLYEEFVDAYIERFPDVKHLPRERAYLRTNSDFIQLAMLIGTDTHQGRGGKWVREHWSRAVEKYFDPERWQGKHTMADLCRRIDEILAWKPRNRNGNGNGFKVAEARGKKQ